MAKNRNRNNCKPYYTWTVKSADNHFLQNHIFFYMDMESLKDSDNNYDKIKHLVEVDDDILAVFIVMSSQIRDLYIAKGANIGREYVNSISATLNFNDNIEITKDGKKGVSDSHNLLGKLKWVYLNMRI